MKIGDSVDDYTPLKIGDRIDDYTLLYECGKGGFGTVFLAQKDDGRDA